MGATNPAEAAPGTIRADFASEITSSYLIVVGVVLVVLVLAFPKGVVGTAIERWGRARS